MNTNPQDGSLTNSSGGWKFQVISAFIISLGAMVIGITYLPVAENALWIKGFLALGTFFLTTSCFSLAKTLRDEHEEKRLINRLSDAKIEAMLQDYEMRMK